MEPSMEPNYILYQATHANGRGNHPGIFGLAHSGKLSTDDWVSWRRANQ
jgi:hypothetical protein